MASSLVSGLFGTAAPAAVIVTYRVDRAVVPTWQKVVSVICAPGGTELTLPFEEVATLEDTTGCPAPGTVSARLSPLPAAGQCDPAELPPPEQLAGLRPRAEATARVFSEWEKRTYCDALGEEYGARLTLTLARLP